MPQRRATDETDRTTEHADLTSLHLAKVGSPRKDEHAS